MTELQTDLHIHTTASDGVLAPSQVVFRAKERGLTCLAVSDHDTIAGVAEAQRAAAQAGIILIPAVELSTGGEQEIHILGYGVPQGDARLEAFLSRMAQERMTRADRMLEKLAALGMPLDQAEIPVKSGGVIGRPQIARAMLARGYAASVQEAFDRYLGKGCPAYVPREMLEPSKAIALLRSLRAVPVLAHPGLLGWSDDMLAQALPAWIQAGLLGMEVYHPAHLPDQFDKWAACAHRHHLLVTGGSDFHAEGDKHADLGAMRAHWPGMHADTQRLLDTIETLKGN